MESRRQFCPPICLQTLTSSMHLRCVFLSLIMQKSFSNKKKRTNFIRSTCNWKSAYNLPGAFVLEPLLYNYSTSFQALCWHRSNNLIYLVQLMAILKNYPKRVYKCVKELIHCNWLIESFQEKRSITFRSSAFPLFTG